MRRVGKLNVLISAAEHGVLRDREKRAMGGDMASCSKYWMHGKLRDYCRLYQT